MTTKNNKFKYGVVIQIYMSFTEIQHRNGKKYYYRTKSKKARGKVTKKRIYLGKNIDKIKLKNLEREADEILNKSINKLLTNQEIKDLDKIKKEFQKLPEITFENRYEAFVAKFTYDSNAIEGNTISLKETSYILFENRTPHSKSLREINEILNHKNAFDFIVLHKEDINKEFICEIQKLVTQNTMKKHLEDLIGRYRNVQVYIRGVNFIPPKPEEVPIEMKLLLRWYNSNKKKIHPLILSAYFHAAFEGIHPFVDGNGRTGRLLMNFILHKNRFPMIDIPNSKKLFYYACLEQAQQKGNLRNLVKFLFDLITKNNPQV